ncbi:SGNH/GDSL hydrolase family protein, partial [Candidatus Magnetobacterium casense]|nr:SGNH/GDSL hydrolase family protein [Candidatus Magnetobacterium casensis]
MGLERFPRDVQSLGADVVVIQYGLNDCNCWLTDGGLPRVSREAFEANLIEMVKRAQRFGAKRVILPNNYPTLRYKVMLSGERFEDANSRYSEIIANIAKGNAGVEFCDIRAVFGAYEGPLDDLLMPWPD